MEKGFRSFLTSPIIEKRDVKKLQKNSKIFM